MINQLYGICTGVDNNKIYVENKGILDVNVTGLTCIGDKLTTCSIPGKAQAIRYSNQDETTFGKRSIGKVVGLYNDYSKVKVLLDIE